MIVSGAISFAGFRRILEGGWAIALRGDFGCEGKESLKARLRRWDPTWPKPGMWRLTKSGYLGAKQSVCQKLYTSEQGTRSSSGTLGQRAPGNWNAGPDK